MELRRASPRWGPRTILHRLGREGVGPLPGRSSVHRVLVRHGLIDLTRRRRRRSDYKRWERSGPWSCGRWTPWAGSTWPAAPRYRSSPASTTTRGSACAPAW